MSLMKLTKRLVEFVMGKPHPIVRIYTHYYYNHRGELVQGIIEKTDRGVIYIRNQNECVVKLQSKDVHRLPI